MFSNAASHYFGTNISIKMKSGERWRGMLPHPTVTVTLRSPNKEREVTVSNTAVIIFKKNLNPSEKRTF